MWQIAVSIGVFFVKNYGLSFAYNWLIDSALTIAVKTETKTDDAVLNALIDEKHIVLAMMKGGVWPALGSIGMYLLKRHAPGLLFDLAIELAEKLAAMTRTNLDDTHVAKIKADRALILAELAKKL